MYTASLNVERKIETEIRHMLNRVFLCIVLFIMCYSPWHVRLPVCVCV